MTTKAVDKVRALKDTFGTPGRPVTNQELIDFKRNDPKGFDELVEALLKAQK